MVLQYVRVGKSEWAQFVTQLGPKWKTEVLQMETERENFKVSLGLNT